MTVEVLPMLAALSLLAREIVERVNEVRDGNWTRVPAFLIAGVAAVCGALAVPEVPVSLEGIVGLWAGMILMHEAKGYVEDRRRGQD